MNLNGRSATAFLMSNKIKLTSDLGITVIAIVVVHCSFVSVNTASKTNLLSACMIHLRLGIEGRGSGHPKTSSQPSHNRCGYCHGCPSWSSPLQELPVLGLHLWFCTNIFPTCLTRTIKWDHPRTPCKVTLSSSS